MSIFNFIPYCIYIFCIKIINLEPGWNTWTNPNISVPPPQLPLRHTLLPEPPFGPPNTSIPPPFDIQSDGYWQRFSNTNPERIELQTKVPNLMPPLEHLLPTPLDAAKRKTLPTWIR